MNEPSARDFHYEAFISYSHAGDSQRAPAIQKALQRFGKPWFVPSSVKICRDDTSLGLTGDLPQAIQQRLEQSKCLILLACPEAAQSKWVENEIRFWLQHRPTDPLLIILTGGELAWGDGDFDWTKSTALPPALKNIFKTEPLWADLRQFKAEQELDLSNPEFFRQIARVVAGMRSAPLDIVLTQAAVEERAAARKFGLVVAGLCVLAVALLAIGALSFKTWQQQHAENQKKDDDKNRQSETARQQEAQRKQADAADKLANAAEALMSDDRELSTLLAMSAVEMSATQQAEHALRRSLVSPAEPIVLRGHSATVWDAQFSADGRRVMTASFDKTVRLWDAATGSNILTLAVAKPNGDPAFGVLSRDGSRILTMTKPESLAIGNWETEIPLRLYDTATGKLLISITNQYAVDASLSPNNKQIVTAGFDTSVKVWNADTGKIQFELPGHDIRVASSRFSLDGKWIVTASWDGTVRVWAADTGKSRAVLRAPSDMMVESASFSADGSKILTMISVRADEAKQLQLWDWMNFPNSPQETFQGHNGFITSFALSLDGKLLATSSLDKTARIWSTADGKCRVVQRHEERVTCVDISPNGKWAVSASVDLDARIWDAASGELLMPLGTNHFLRTCAAFSPDGKHIVTGTANGEVALYTCEICGSVDDLKRLARSRVARQLTAAERQKYLPEPQGH